MWDESYFVHRLTNNFGVDVRSAYLMWGFGLFSNPQDHMQSLASPKYVKTMRCNCLLQNLFLDLSLFISEFDFHKPLLKTFQRLFYCLLKLFNLQLSFLIRLSFYVKFNLRAIKFQIPKPFASLKGSDIERCRNLR